MEAEQECTTPKKHGIPEVLVCPPPPRKKNRRTTSRAGPRDGYFQSPELDKFLRVGAAHSGGAWDED